MKGEFHGRDHTKKPTKEHKKRKAVGACGGVLHSVSERRCQRYSYMTFREAVDNNDRKNTDKDDDLKGMASP